MALIESFITPEEDALNEEFLEKLKESYSKNWDGKKIRDSVISKYGEEIILSEYERLFLRLTKNS